MQIFYQILKYIRRTAWALLVAYMVGWHNVYKQVDRMPDDIVLTIEVDEVQEDNAPKD